MKHTVRLCLLLGWLSSLDVRADWLPADRYQAMNMIERRQFDAARKRYKGKQFKAAAAEFEKFKVHFPNSPALAYAVLYQGLSLHGANFRHKAIRVYQEVIDYFGADVDPAAKAQFQIGLAHADNGDDRRSLAAMKQLADHEQWSKHALAAGAIRRLGEQYFAKGEKAEALARWEQVYRDFRESNPVEADRCKAQVAAYRMQQAQFDAYVTWLRELTGPEEEPISDFAWGRQAFDLVWQGTGKDGWALKPEQKAELGRSFTAYFAGYQEAFEAAGEGWDFHARTLRWVSRCVRNPRELQLVVDNATTWLEGQKRSSGEDWAYWTRLLSVAMWYVRKEDAVDHAVRGATAFLASNPNGAWKRYQWLIDRMLKHHKDRAYTQALVAASAAFAAEVAQPKKRDDAFMWLSDTLLSAGESQLAVELLGKVSHEARRKFALHRIVGDKQGNWPQAVALLQQVEATNDSHFAPKSREARAKAYKNKLEEYAQAISLYFEIDDPPRTLWEIQDCYWRWGKQEDACQMLREIETVFPDQGPAAAWKRVHYQEKMRNKDKAIAEARRILKVYPKSKESSSAHQLLEKYGIATGGGLDEN